MKNVGDKDRSRALKAFYHAVREYVPTHNKRAWNSDETDKITQLLQDAKRLGVVSEADIEQITKKPSYDVQGWFAGYEIPKSQIRFKIRRELLKRLQAEF